MKKKLVTILVTIAASITLGYLFILSWLLGFLASRQLAGKSAGERGKVRSIILPLRGWWFHLHHWLYSLCLIAFSSATGIHFLSPIITYRLLGGSIFQGIYSYSDWHVILIRRRASKGEGPLEAAGEPGGRTLPASEILEGRSPTQKYSPSPFDKGTGLTYRGVKI